MSITWLERNELNTAAMSRLLPADMVVDIGCGLRPQTLVSARTHICCEAHAEYVEILRNWLGNDPRFLIVHALGNDFLSGLADGSVDSVFMLDVIEHLDKVAGQELLKQAVRVARKQVVLFTPLGFMPQDYSDDRSVDGWGLHGTRWQRHLSGWTPDDFDDSWEILACRNYHDFNGTREALPSTFGAIWAIHSAASAASRQRDPILGVILPSLTGTSLETRKQILAPCIEASDRSTVLIGTDPGPLTSPVELINEQVALRVASGLARDFDPPLRVPVRTVERPAVDGSVKVDERPEIAREAERIRAFSRSLVADNCELVAVLFDDPATCYHTCAAARSLDLPCFVYFSAPELLADQRLDAQAHARLSDAFRSGAVALAPSAVAPLVTLSLGVPCRVVDPTTKQALPARSALREWVTATELPSQRDEHRPLVSIIVPTFNRADMLEETLDSILSQDYPNIECIVLDDGSTDQTAALLEAYRGRVRVESHANMGETKTVNKGLRLSTGDIICVVNSDDPLLPGAIAAVAGALIANPRALAAYCDWIEIDRDSTPLAEHRLPAYTLESMLDHVNVAMGPGTFFRRSALELIGVRDEEVRYTGDLDYWFRLALHGPFVHVPQVLATHRVHANAASTTSRGGRMAGEVVRLIEKTIESPLFPPALATRKNLIRANAHAAASSFCGSDASARNAHERDWNRYREIARSEGFTPLELPASQEPGRLRRLWTRLRVSGPSAVIVGAMLAVLATLRVVDLFRSKKAGLSKTLVVSHVLPPSWSGQAVILRRILEKVPADRWALASVHSGSSRNDRSGDEAGLTANRYSLAPDQIPFLGHRTLRGGERLQLLVRACGIAWALRRERARSVVGCSGDLLDAPAACLAARLTGASFYLYLFDDYVYQWIDPGTRARASRFESLMVKRCEGVIAPNEFMAKEFERRHGLHPFLVRNVCEDASVVRGRRPAKTGSRLDIVYTGAVYHVNAAALRRVAKAVGLVGPQATLHLYTAQEPETLRRNQIAGRNIRPHPHVGPDEIREIQRRADVLLVPFSHNVAAADVIRTSAPGKLGDYLASGVPILAVVPGDCFVAWYLRTHDCGLVVDTDRPDDIKAALLRLRDDHELTSRLIGNAIRCAAADFSQQVGSDSFQRAVLADHARTPP